MTSRTVKLAVLSVVLLAPALAAAQAPPKPIAPIAPKTEQLDSKACGPSDTQTTVGQGPKTGGGVQMQQSGDLSDKLARSDGVICPPVQIDPDIKAPTPPGGTMPVIPPPGSPGGDQSVQPK